jgi:hypothetical protein
MVDEPGGWCSLGLAGHLPQMQVIWGRTGGGCFDPSLRSGDTQGVRCGSQRSPQQNATSARGHFFANPCTKLRIERPITRNLA